MTIPQALLSFAVLAGLLTLVPGLDTALVVRSVLTGGRPTAFATALGVVSGTLVWGAAAAVGGAALLAVSTAGYRVLAVLGALYMVVLGVRMLRSSFGPVVDLAPVIAARSPWRAYLTGLATNLLNPKVGVFYLATIPQFIPPGTTPVLMGLALAGTHFVLGLAWFTVLIVAGGRLTRVLRTPLATTWIDRLTGVVLIGFGVRLALLPRP